SSRSAALSCRPVWREPPPASSFQKPQALSPEQSESPPRVVLPVFSSQPSSRLFQSPSYYFQPPGSQWSSSSVARLTTRKFVRRANVILRGQILAHLHLIREFRIVRRHRDPQRRNIARRRAMRLSRALHHRHLRPLTRRIRR